MPPTAASASPGDLLARRLTEVVQRAIDVLPSEVVADALAAASPLESAALVIGTATGPELGQMTPWIEALLRGARLRLEIAAAAGGLLSTGQLAELLGVSPQAVLQRRLRNTLLAIPTAQGDWGYPALQLGMHGVRSGVRTVIEANPEIGPWERLAILTQPADPNVEGGETLLERLDDEEEIRRAVRLLESFGVQQAV